MRTPPLRITVRNDVAGKPYVEIESATASYQTTPVRITLWAEDVIIEDQRKDQR